VRSAASLLVEPKSQCGRRGAASQRRGLRAARPFAGLLAALQLALAAAAEVPEPAAPGHGRPRIGLALSGGGARGAAHIGVLEVLEELRIPVDVVSGTSMGSVIGGLYAAGLSPGELGEVIRAVDWVRIFDDRPDRQSLSFRRKQDDRNFLTNLRLAFKNGSFYVPRGLLEGQKLDFLLRALSLGADGVLRFEDLRIPFRAVATDINTGEAVILGTGAVATAQRASMSIPAAFSPVEIDGRMLVDGFVSNNLPIDAAQELGAERIIAVDISTPLAAIGADSSAFAIDSQAAGFAVQENQRRQKERLSAGDVLLTPDLGGLHAASFAQMQQAIDAGRRAAQGAAEALARHSVSEAEYAAWRAQQRRPRQAPPIVDEIRIENDSPLADALIRARVRTRTGAPLDLAVLQQDVERLYGLDAFERVHFDLHRESSGMVLSYRMQRRERGRNYFRIGLHLETDFANDATYSLGLNHVVLPVNAWGAELRSYAQVGDTNIVASEFYQPVDPREWLFAAPHVRYELRDFDVFRNQKRLARFDLETVLAGVDLGANLGSSTQLRAGIAYLDGETDRESGDPALFAGTRFGGGLYAASLEYDTLDNTRFPNDGSFARAEGLLLRKELGFGRSFEQLRLRAGIFRSLWHNTAGVTLRYDTSFGAPAEIQFLDSLGGFGSLSGFERDSISGPHTGLVRLLAYRRIASPAIFAWEFPVYAGGQLEAGNAWQERSDLDDLRYSLGPFFGADTPLGPLYVAYAFGEAGEHQGYLFLGQSF